MFRRLPKNGQLVFRPIERFAAAPLQSQIVGLIIGIKRVPWLKSRQHRQVQIALSAEDARNLGRTLLDAAENAQAKSQQARLN